METPDQDTKKKYVAVAISVVIVALVIGAWVFFNFKKKPDDNTRPKDTTVEVKKQKDEEKQEVADKTDEVTVLKEVKINSEEYTALKEKVEKSYNQAEAELAKASHKYFFKLLGNMSVSIEKARNADSSQDLVTAFRKYQSLEKLIEESNQSQENYKEYAQLKSEIDDLVKKVSSRQGRKYAKDPFLQAGISISNSDEAANTGRFIEAIESLEKTRDSLNSAMYMLDEIVKENWNNGNTALKSGDNLESNTAFVTVKNIDPMYPGIDGAIKRSETIHTVHPKEQNALEYEKNGLLEMANSLYRKILDIDKLSQIAQDGLDRTGDALKRNAINTTIRALDSAISQNLWMKAKGLLEDLKSLSPDDERITNYKRMIEDEIAQSMIEQLRREGAAAEREKEWDVAIDKYEKILIIKPDLADVKKKL